MDLQTSSLDYLMADSFVPSSSPFTVPEIVSLVCWSQFTPVHDSWWLNVQEFCELMLNGAIHRNKMV